MNRHKQTINITHPQIAAEANGWDASKFTAGSEQKLEWLCALGHIWTARVGSRVEGHNCPICSGHRVLSGFNDLATINPQLAAEAHGWDASTVTAHSGKKVDWKCKRGHIWKAKVSDRSSGTRCPVCTNRKVLPGFNDLATTHPILAAQVYNWDPKTLTYGSDKRVEWICEYGHKWCTTVANRTLGYGCPTCSGRIALIGFNDLATTHPNLASEAFGWDPTEITANSNKIRKWKCNFGHVWNTKISLRCRGTGCPSCVGCGFDINKDGWLYLIDNEQLHMFQIGISNFPSRRLDEHSKGGWEVLEVRGPMDGHLARKLEISILKSVKTRGAMMAHKTDITKFDGWTEAWTKDSLPVAGFRQLLDWVYEDDEEKMTKAL